MSLPWVGEEERDGTSNPNLEEVTKSTGRVILIDVLLLKVEGAGEWEGVL
jgi:hypothetical protein